MQKKSDQKKLNWSKPDISNKKWAFHSRFWDSDDEFKDE